LIFFACSARMEKPHQANSTGSALNMNGLDYYNCLGIAKEATQDEVKRAFRRMVRLSHPDLNPNDPEAASRLRRVIIAYRALDDPSDRARYDRVDDLFGARKPREHDPEDVSDLWDRVYLRQAQQPGRKPRRKADARPLLASVICIVVAVTALIGLSRSDRLIGVLRGPAWGIDAKSIRLGHGRHVDPSTDWAVQYWLGEHTQNPRDMFVRTELGRAYLRLAREAMRNGDRETAFHYARMAADIAPHLSTEDAALDGGPGTRVRSRVLNGQRASAAHSRA